MFVGLSIGCANCISLNALEVPSRLQEFLESDYDARMVYAKQSQKITIIVIVHLRSQQGVNATSRSDGVPNVADEEPGICFGKIHSR